MYVGKKKSAHCSWLPWRKDSSGWVKSRGQISLATSSACVCVCPVSPPKKCTCVLLCVVCDHNKTDLALFRLCRSCSSCANACTPIGRAQAGAGRCLPPSSHRGRSIAAGSASASEGGRRPPAPSRGYASGAKRGEVGMTRLQGRLQLPLGHASIA